jgi:hypothetical protein
VKKNLLEKRIDVAKGLGMPPSIINSIIVKEREVREQADKSGTSAKKRKTIK